MKIKKLLVIAFITILASCESNNDADLLMTEAELIGTWNVTDQTLDAEVSFTENGKTETASINSYSEDLNFTLTFSNNPKVVKAEGNYTLISTVNADGRTETSEEYIEADVDDFPSWSLNGNNIVLTDDNDLPQNMIIESYNGTKLVLKSEIDETESDQGQSITIKTTMLIVLEK